MEAKVYKTLVWVQFLRALMTIRTPRGITTYGRHVNPNLSGTSTVPARVAWFAMELPAVLVPLFIFSLGEHRKDMIAKVLLIVFEMHYVQRTFIYPLRLNSSSSSRMPSLTVALGAIFNTLNAYIQTRWISHFGTYPDWWWKTPQFVIGAAILVTGMIINIWADGVLISLRKNSKDKSYKVPTGGMFEYVSCPNYLGEAIEWLGWGILTWSAAGFGFFLYTAANLFTRAIAHHKWYLKKFPNYPKERTAVVPFLC